MMGDIVWGILIIIFLVVATLINNKSKHPDTERLVRLILGAGAVLGLLVSFTQYGTGKAIGILLFYFQLTGIAFISFNKRKVAYIILLITLLLQIPILHLDSFSYRSQTLFGLNIEHFPGKYIDLEPGSYVSYFDKTLPLIQTSVTDDYKPFPHGINLTSLMLFIYFIRSKNLWTKSTTANTAFGEKTDWPK